MRILVVDGLRAIQEKLLLGKNIHTKYVTCGRPDCRCRLGQRHGPYYYFRQRTESGKYKDVYVKSTSAKLGFEYEVVGRENVIIEVRSARDVPDIFQKCPVFVVKKICPSHMRGH